MKLVEKGAQAALPDGLTKMKLTMTWSAAIDMDISAWLFKNDQHVGQVYYGDKGDVNSGFFMSLDQDAGVGDSQAASGNTETMLASKLMEDLYDTMIIVSTDYGAISGARPEANIPEDLKMSFMGITKDGKKEEHEVAPSSWGKGNAAVVAALHHDGMNWSLKTIGVPFTGTLDTVMGKAFEIYKNSQA